LFGFTVDCTETGELLVIIFNKMIKAELIKIGIGFLFVSAFLLSREFDLLWAFSRSGMVIGTIWFFRLLFHNQFGIARNNKLVKYLVWLPIIGFGLYAYLGAVLELVLEYSIFAIFGIIVGTVLMIYAIVKIGGPLIFGKDIDD